MFTLLTRGGRWITAWTSVIVNKVKIDDTKEKNCCCQRTSWPQGSLYCTSSWVNVECWLPWKREYSTLAGALLCIAVHSKQQSNSPHRSLNVCDTTKHWQMRSQQEVKTGSHVNHAPLRASPVMSHWWPRLLEKLLYSQLQLLKRLQICWCSIVSRLLWSDITLYYSFMFNMVIFLII